jgi:intein-encoded DNA endonuclease-like protein
MNKRIRYVKDSNGNTITQNYIKNVNGSQYRAGFIAGGKAGFVKSVDDDTTHIQLTSTSPHKMKIKIKKTLEKLGCQFDKEIRQPRVTDESETVPDLPRGQF